MAAGTPDFYSPRETLVNLLALVDDIDGTADGIITLEDLNSAQCEMLAKLAGIDTSVTTGGDLIDKLDALDGTMDGRLTLSELNTSNVKTNLDSNLTKLDSVATKLDTVADKLDSVSSDLATIAGKLDTQIANLADIVVATEARKFAGYAKLTTSCSILWSDLTHTVGRCTLWSHPENTDDIYIYDTSDCSGGIDYTLSPGETRAIYNAQTHMSAKAASGTQYLGFLLSG